ncbi:MAG: YihY/virulence factor BrkB family protein [Myxococcales bacterium]|nr:YihY/virulence factor BrkB family protein [Myxococcales bacterium]
MLRTLARIAKRLLSLGRGTWERYDHSHGELLAAALSFYGVLSLAPLALLAVMSVGLVFEQERAREALLDYVARFSSQNLAEQTAEALDAMRMAASDVTAILALATLLWASSRMFVQLQSALNAMWGVHVRHETTRQAIVRMVIRRLLAFGMVAVCGALLMALLVLNTALSALAHHLIEPLALVGLSPIAAFVQNYLVGLCVLTCFFAAIYRVLPDVRIPWRDVWVGASLTAGLMLVGTAVLSFALGRLSSGWVHGSLGSIAAFVLWTYYQAQVFMLGVAFTREWTERFEGPVDPEDYAGMDSDEGA